MTSVAIVEDDEDDAKALVDFFIKFGQENNRMIKTTVFENADLFLSKYAMDFDMVFFDIQMPILNGMDAAARLREIDPLVPIIFVTNMVQYAVKGYAVNATDFIVKPISYASFSTLVTKVFKNMSKDQNAEIMVKTAKGMQRVNIFSISSIEVFGHRAVIHTDAGDAEIWSSLANIEKKLPKEYFARCNKYIIVNLKYVELISGDKISVDGREIIISRPKKKEFMQRMLEYYGEKL